MPTLNSLRKIPLICFVIFIAIGITNSSLSQTVNYEAANWKTWLLDSPHLLTVDAPPAAGQLKAELKSLKQRIGNLDEKKRTDIKYWDAGAPAYRWNQIAPELLSQDPKVMLRTPGAWMNIAIYDATILAWKEKLKYKKQRPHEMDKSIEPVVNAPLTYSYPCEHSVTAAAAAHVLAYFFPTKADSILQLAHNASQSRVNAGVQLSSDIEAGWKLGEQVARQIIEKAKNDGSANVYKGEVNKDPKKWTGKYPLGINLGSFTPIVIKAADQFRPPAPPEFESDMKELRELKQTFKTKSIAYSWATRGPEFWNDLASLKIFENGMSDDAPAAARIYTVLNTAYHEMTIAIMDAKYAYWGIRPDQLDPSYKPLMATPPFPGYPSGHAAGAGTSCAVMEYFFPEDAKEFQKLAQECADSRLYAGIHFRTDNEVGLKMGKQLGKYVVETFTKPGGNLISSDK